MNFLTILIVSLITGLIATNQYDLPASQLSCFHDPCDDAEVVLPQSKSLELGSDLWSMIPTYVNFKPIPRSAGGHGLSQCHSTVAQVIYEDSGTSDVHLKSGCIIHFLGEFYAFQWSSYQQ